MFRYIVKRLLFFIPTLILISIISFMLMQFAPGDPVLAYMELDGEDVVLNTGNASFKKSYQKYFQKLHLDKPAFYFSVKPSNYPKEKPRWMESKYNQLYSAYLDQHVLATDAENYINSLKNIETTMDEVGDNKGLAYFESFLMDNSLVNISGRLDVLLHQIQHKQYVYDHNDVRSKLITLLDHKKTIILPSVAWNGFQNQYHYWIKSFSNSHSLRSYQDGNPVMDKIAKSIKWTLAMVIPALLISFLCSILLGVYQATHREGWQSKMVNLFNYFVFSIPLFWLASLILVGLGGRFVDLDAIVSQSDNIWSHFTILILPILTLVLHHLAYISRQMYHAMMKQAKEDYLKTAKAKGTRIHDITWRHQFRNALLPMITLMSAAVPASFSGSVVLELIFNIPGMGRLMYQSILQMDWPVVFGVLLFLSFISLVFMLIGDLLYAYVNPKIRFEHA